MRRPKEVFLAGARWSVGYVDHEIVEGGDKCCGLCREEKREILIYVPEGACEDYIKQCFVHEALHAASSSCGGQWPDDEEGGVRHLERPMLTLFTDERNAPVIRWLRREP